MFVSTFLGLNFFLKIATELSGDVLIEKKRARKEAAAAAKKAAEKKKNQKMFIFLGCFYLQ